MENYEDNEEFVEEFCNEYEIVHDRYLDFRDEIKEDELNIKIINLIEEHCERGFKEWSKWGEESPYSHSEYYPIFIRFLKQRFLKNLWESYQIRLTPFE